MHPEGLKLLTMSFIEDIAFPGLLLGSLASCWVQKGPILTFPQGCWVPGSKTARPDVTSHLEEGELLQNLRRALEKCRNVQTGAQPASACGCHLQSPQLLVLGFSWEGEVKGRGKKGSQTFFCVVEYLRSYQHFPPCLIHVY